MTDAIKPCVECFTSFPGKYGKLCLGHMLEAMTNHIASLASEVRRPSPDSERVREAAKTLVEALYEVGDIRACRADFPKTNEALDRLDEALSTSPAPERVRELVDAREAQDQNLTAYMAADGNRKLLEGRCVELRQEIGDKVREIAMWASRATSSEKHELELKAQLVKEAGQWLKWEALARRYKAAFKRWIGFCRAERNRLDALLFDEKLDLRHRREDGLWTAGNLETQRPGEAFKDPRAAIGAYLKALSTSPAPEKAKCPPGGGWGYPTGTQGPNMTVENPTKAKEEADGR